MRIIILPGLDGTGRLVEDFAHELGNAHDIEIVSYPVELTSYSELGTWLESRLPQEDYAIIAESFSGPLAIQIGKQNPRSMKALVLVATFARSPRKAPSILLNALKVFRHFPNFYVQATLPFVLGNAGTPRFLASYRTTLREVPFSTLIGRLRAVLEVNVLDMLADIAAPIAYIRPTEDRLVPKTIASDFASHCDLFHSIDAPHFVLQSKPQEAAGIVRAFLDEQK